MKLEKLYSLFLENPKISTDTRKITEGSIFFALKGDNFNGNKYAEEALEKGASYAIIDEEKYRKSDNFIIVDDVLKALQDLATYHRSQLTIPVIGLTGSNGKTTTKELIRAVLSQKHNCLATVGNLNNHIGVPLTILSITKEHEIAIIEMGANHVGEIESLCRIALPNFGLITNIGRAHIGEFGGFDNIIKAKTELYKTMLQSNKHLIFDSSEEQNDDRVIFVNGDDMLLMDKSDGRKRHTYGSKSMYDTEGVYHSQDPFLNVSWESKDILIKTQLIGKYNTDNILAAVAIGEHFNVSDNMIKEALENYTPTNNRSQIQKTAKNTLIMDAYNANPSSVEVAIENLLTMEANKKFFILGDMLELG
ncbi:MAG: UDP-N-acetylmuramoyl-tripeptide--D-alanyl-D-alanine ligase, partial [Patiriisocius sp.]